MEASLRSHCRTMNYSSGFCLSTASSNGGRKVEGVGDRVMPFIDVLQFM